MTKHIWAIVIMENLAYVKRRVLAAETERKIIPPRE